jgi:hypothetical protein
MAWREFWKVIGLPAQKLLSRKPGIQIAGAISEIYSTIRSAVDIHSVAPYAKFTGPLSGHFSVVGSTGMLCNDCEFLVYK